MVGMMFPLWGCATSRPPRPGTLRARTRLPIATHSAPTGWSSSCGPEPRICLTLSLADADRLEVRMEVPPEVVPEDVPVALELTGTEFRDDTGNQVSERDLARGAGRDSQGALVIRYSVPLPVNRTDELEGPPTTEPAESRNWARRGGWHLLGSSFVPRLRVGEEDVDAPVSVWTQFEQPLVLWSAGGAENMIDAERLDRLSQESFELGPLIMTERQVGTTALRVGFSGTEEQRPQLERTADLIAQATRTLSQLLGPAPVDAALIAFHAGGSSWGQRRGSSIVQVGDALPAVPLSPETERTITLLTELWNPGLHRVDATWMHEGINAYVMARTVGELRAADEPNQLRTIVRAYQRYRSHVEASGDDAVRLADAGPGEWMRDGGIASGFCLETHLAQSGGSVGVLLSTTFARDDDPLTLEHLVEDLAGVNGLSAGYLTALLTTRGTFGIGDCLERAGYEASEVEFQGMSDVSLTEGLMQVGALHALRSGPALWVESAMEDSQFQAGDLIVSIAGSPVGSLNEMAYALRDVPEGGRFAVQIRRAGQPLTIELRLGATSNAERTARVRTQIIGIPAE